MNMEIEVWYRGSANKYPDIESARTALNALPVTEYPSGISAVGSLGVYYERRNGSAEWIPIERFDKCDVCGDRNLPKVGHERPCSSGGRHTHKSKEMFPKSFDLDAYAMFTLPNNL